MDWLRSIDWAAVAFLLLAGALSWLVISAMRRMSKKKSGSAGSGDDGESRKKSPKSRTSSVSSSRREEKIRAQKARHQERAKAKARARAGEAEGDQGEGIDEDEGELEQASSSPSTGRSKGKTRRAKKGNKGRRAGRGKPTAEKTPLAEPAAEVSRPAGIDSEEEQRRLTAGLAKTRGGFISRLGKLFADKQIDESLLDEVEEVLFTADIGVRTSQELIEGLRQELSRKQLGQADAVWRNLRRRTEQILAENPPISLKIGTQRPFVLLVVGVNGAGKTTTIGKIAARLKAAGHSMILAAGDTFRAAAAEQLEIWGERAQVPVVRGKQGADPASVVVEAIKRAKAEKIEVVIADTAGRLQTKVSLMEELQKVGRAIGKQVEGAPHETYLVLDATTGQNAISQAKLFREVIDISGIVLTKLDGTAKGGVVIGISNELKLPVNFVGIGEGVEDLREFDPGAFVNALYGPAESVESAG